MENINITLPKSKKVVSVLIERKKMKTCRLKVFPSLEVKISVPKMTTLEWINKYLCEKSEWVEKKIDVFKVTTGYAATTEIKNGMSIKILGEDMIFSVRESKKEYVLREHRILHIGVLNTENQEQILKVFEKWWRLEAIKEYQTYFDKLYPIIGKYNIPTPKLFTKKMKTLWGSCSIKRGTITINQYLLKAKPACIEYVILHELIHMIYPNHSKVFYDFLSNYMPDWKERKRFLDYEVVHGL